MVASISSNNSSVSNRADSIFSRLDSKNQGYIDKTDLQDALSKIGGDGKDGGQPVNVDDTFSALDGDSDGKITKSELTDAMSKLSDQLNAQFDASRAGRGGQPPEGPPPGGQAPGGHGGGGASGAGSADGTSADYIAAADTDGDGTVSEAEQAAYDKKVASEKTDGTRQAGRQKDPMRELAHAMHLLKAYAENGGGGDTSTASGATDAAGTADAAGTSGSVSIEA